MMVKLIWHLEDHFKGKNMSSMTLVFRYLSALFAVLILSGHAQTCADEKTSSEDQQAVMSSIESMLKMHWNTEIKTLKANVCFFRVMQGPSKMVSCGQMQEFLYEVGRIWDATHNPVNIRDFSSTLPMRDAEKTFPNCWLEGTITQRGEDVRNTFEANLVPGGLPESFDMSYSKGMDIYASHDNNQVSIFEYKSRWKKFELGDLRYKPHDISRYAVESITKETARLRAENSVLEFDRATGGVKYMKYAHGRTRLERWQFGFTTHQGEDGSETSFPAISAKVEYVDDYLTNLFLFIINDFKFNIGIDDSEFRISAQSGTTTVLFPSSNQQEAVATTKIVRPTSDVLSVVPKLRESILRKPQKVQPSASRLALLVGLNVISLVLVTIGIIYYRRYRRPPDADKVR